MPDADYSVTSCDAIGCDGRDDTRHIRILMSSAKTNMSSQWTHQPVQLYLCNHQTQTSYRLLMIVNASS